MVGIKGFSCNVHHHHHRHHHHHHHIVCYVSGLLTCSIPINSLEVFCRIVLGFVSCMAPNFLIQCGSLSKKAYIQLKGRSYIIFLLSVASP
jgi:hypothetical protein